MMGAVRMSVAFGYTNPMSRRFQFNLRWMFVLTCAAAAAAEMMHLAAVDRTQREGLHYHALGITILFGIASFYLWGPRVAGWAAIVLLAVVMFLVLYGASP